MPTVASGYRSATPTGIATERLIVEMQDQIYAYDPNRTPMLTFLTGSASGSRASNPTYHHLEDEPLPAWDTTAENMDTTETGMDVSHGSYFRAGDLVLIPTSSAGGFPEVVVVQSVSSNTLTIVRDWVNNNSGVGGTSSSGCNVFIIGNVNEEASGTRTLLQTTETQITNYCQIIKTPWGISGTLDATATYGGPDRVTQAKKAATQHAFEQERTFLFGTKRSTTGTSTFSGGSARAVRATGGLLYWLTTNSVNVNGTLTHSNIESLAEKVFRYGSSTKVLLCSRRVMSQLDNIAEARIETVPEADTYGVHVRRYVTGHGDFLIKIHDMLVNDYAGFAIAVDMANVSKRFTVNSEGKRDALARMNIQTPDEDATKNEYLSEVGLHVHLEKSHGWLYGVS